MINSLERKLRWRFYRLKNVHVCLRKIGIYKSKFQAILLWKLPGCLPCIAFLLKSNKNHINTLWQNYPVPPINTWLLIIFTDPSLGPWTFWPPGLSLRGRGTPIPPKASWCSLLHYYFTFAEAERKWNRLNFQTRNIFVIQ